LDNQSVKTEIFHSSNIAFQTNKELRRQSFAFTGNDAISIYRKRSHCLMNNGRNSKRQLFLRMTSYPEWAKENRRRKLVGI